MNQIEEILRSMDYGDSPESPEQALNWITSNQPLKAYIDGQWNETGCTFSTINPTTCKALAEVFLCTSAEVNLAVTAAKEAFPKWRALSGHGRAKYLYAIARSIQRHSRLFSVIESLDNGKPIREARDIDIPLAIRHFYHHAGWAQLWSNHFPMHEPLGVVGQIVPWNFPLLMLAWKVAPALATGNTVVFKSAENTPISAILFAQICDEIGLPPGVFNLVNGAEEVGQAIVNHSDIKKIAFTGSTAVGKLIRTQTAGTGKKLSLELGGKSPFIVLQNADLDSAVEGVVSSIFFNQGQVCCAGSRLLVQESISDSFLQKLRARMSKIRVGDPLDKSTDMGPLVSDIQLGIVDSYVKNSVNDGGVVWQSSEKIPVTGHFYAPTLITGLTSTSTVVQDEIFGPVLVSQSFRTPHEAVQLANNTRYGLSASVWSESINEALTLAPQIKAGVVWVNGANLFDASCGFGGYRESGFGREGGVEGLREYLRPSLPKKPSDNSIRTTLINAQNQLVDQTIKLYINGKKVRSDSGYSRSVIHKGECLAVVPQANRKDFRNAVEAAVNSAKWAEMSGHARAQVLFFMAENLANQKSQVLQTLKRLLPLGAAKREIDLSIDGLFAFAGWADKYEGVIHRPPTHGIVTALKEPVGVITIVCPEAYPLSGLLIPIAAAISQGNRIVAIPSGTIPHIIRDAYDLFDTSDLPDGVVNLITGNPEELAQVVATHADVQALWWLKSQGSASETAERESAHTLMRTWIPEFFNPTTLDAVHQKEMLAHAIEIKNIWIPYAL